MKKTLKFLLFVIVLLAGGALGYQFIQTDYAYSGDSKSVSEVFEGDIRITGSHNDLTIRAGSDVSAVTVLGSDNTIWIEDSAEVGRIRGVGNNNHVIAPEGTEIDLSMLKGENNTRRQDQVPSLDGL